MRMFVAAIPPDEAIEHLANFLEPRQQEPSRLRWTGTDQWHLTLAFLPAVADRALDELVEQLAGAAAGRSSFTVRLQGAGAFPNPAEARALWAGVAGELTPLQRLAGATRTAAGLAGVAVEGGKFRPHLTLARSNRPVEATRWLRVLDVYQGPDWPVTEFALVESQLGGAGRGRTRYQVRALFNLGQQASVER